jgi:hypothetical protein
MSAWSGRWRSLIGIALLVQAASLAWTSSLTAASEQSRGSGVAEELVGFDIPAGKMDASDGLRGYRLRIGGEAADSQWQDLFAYAAGQIFPVDGGGWLV